MWNDRGTDPDKQGFGAVREKCKPAMLCVYNNFVERDPAGRTYDTVSKYPHRAVLSLVNRPIGMEPKNPSEIFPNTNADRYHGHFLFRNQWKDETDVVVIVKLKAEPAIDIWGCAFGWSRSRWVRLPRRAWKATRSWSADRRSGLTTSGSTQPRWRGPYRRSRGLMISC